MATKRTIHEIRSKGGEDVERQLRKIGALGEETGKKIDKGSQQASKGLKAVDAAISRTRGSLNRMAASLGPVGVGLSKLGVAGLAAAGATVATGGLFALTVRAIESTDALAKQAKAVGINAEVLQEYRFAAGLAGIDTATLDTSLEQFIKRLGEFQTKGTGLVQVLEKYNAGLADQIKGTTSVESALEIYLRAISQAGSATEQAALATEAFGRSGGRMTLLIREGYEALEAMRQRARDLGLVIENSLVAGAEEASDRFSELKSILSVNLDRALLQLAPVVESLGIAFGNAAPKIAAFVQSFLDLEDLGAAALNQRLITTLQQLEQATAAQETARGRNRAGANTRVAELRAEAAQIEALLKLRQAESNQATLTADARAEAAKKEQEARKALAELETKQTADQKKYDAERKKALADLAAAEEKAARVGLTQIQVLERERDKAVTAQAQRLTQGIIDAEEFARFRIALFATTEEEITDIHREEAEKRTEVAAKEAEKAAEALQKPFDNFIENTQREFADLFTEALQGDVKNFEDFFRTIKGLAARTAGEMAALFVFSPQLFGAGGAGLSGAVAGTAPGLANIGGGLASLGGGFLPAGGLSPLASLGLAGGLGGALGFGLTGSLGGGIGGAAGGAGGFYAGVLLGSTIAGPIGGALFGSVLGSLLGDRLFGGGSNNKSRFGFTSTGFDRGVQGPFGGINVNAAQNIDAGGIANLLVSIDERLARVLTPGQLGAVQSGILGTGDFFSAGKVDNEIFDVVKNRLVATIDAAVGNSVASQILNDVPRGNENIEQLVANAEQIIALVAQFNDEGPATQAEAAIRALNQQFDDLAKLAERLGLSVEVAEQRRADAIAKLGTDFDESIRQQILALTDPLSLTLEQLTIGQEQRLAEATALGRKLVEVERLNGLERAQAIEQAFGGANSSINAFLDSLRFTGAGGLSAAAQTSNVSARFNELLGLARTDPAARGDLAALLPTFLDLKRQELGSTPAFFEFTSFLDSTLRNLVDQTATVNTLQDIGAAITAGDNAVIATLEDTNKKLVATVEELRADINLLLNAPGIIAA